jgi:DNA-binding FadR family transcriptional regulator
VDGRFPLHSKLPAERVLAQELETSRVTLRKALALLEAEGRIWRHVGRGTFIGSSAPTSAGGSLAIDIGASPLELLEARLVIEPAIAAHAATSASGADIAYLKLCLEKREGAPTAELYELWDHRLHRAVADATHNPLLISILDMLNQLRQQPEWKAYRRTTLTAGRRVESAQQHRSIVAAIEARDPQSAFTSMQTHIRTIQTNIDHSKGVAHEIVDTGP